MKRCSWIIVKVGEIKAGFSRQQDSEFQLPGKKLKKKKKQKKSRGSRIRGRGMTWIQAPEATDAFESRSWFHWRYMVGGQEESLHTIFLPLFPKKIKLSHWHFMSGQERLYPTRSFSPTPETFNPLASFNQIDKCLEILKTWSYPCVSNWILNIQMSRHF